MSREAWKMPPVYLTGTKIHGTRTTGWEPLAYIDNKIVWGWGVDIIYT